MDAPGGYPPPDKRAPPAPAVPRRVPPRKWTGTLPDKYVATLVELVSMARLRSSVEALASFPTRHTFSAHIAPAADWIVGQFTTAGYANVVKLPWTRSGQSGENIVCTKPGATNSGRVAIVCAHYDSRMESLADATSRAPGADDNASGVAAVLEIARILARRHPARHAALRPVLW